MIQDQFDGQGATLRFSRKVQTIAKRMKSYGERLQTSCSRESLKALQRRARVELACDIPDEYARFLTKVNGLDWNGLVVYASERTPISGYTDRFIEGFVEANLDFRDHEPLKDYLIFADDGVALFVYHITEGKYEVLTRIGLTRLESFDSFSQMLVNALSGHIQE